LFPGKGVLGKGWIDYTFFGVVTGKILFYRKYFFFIFSIFEKGQWNRKGWIDYTFFGVVTGKILFYRKYFFLIFLLEKGWTYFTLKRKKGVVEKLIEKMVSNWEIIFELL